MKRYIFVHILYFCLLLINFNIVFCLLFLVVTFHYLYYTLKGQTETGSAFHKCTGVSEPIKSTNTMNLLFSS